MKRERFKSILLILLFVVSLSLTQRLWFDLPFGEVISLSNNKNIKEIDVDVTDILSPQSFTVSFGGGDHTVFFSEPYEVWNITKADQKKEVWIWETAKLVLRDYLKNDYDIEEIDEDEWKKIKKFKSIKLDFACEVPGNSLISLLSGKDSNMSKIKDKVNTILIPATEEERANVYLGNSEVNRYLKLTGSNMNEEIKGLIENIYEVGERKGYISYYTIEDIFAVENDVLTPVFDEIDIRSSIKNVNELDLLGEDSYADEKGLLSIKSYSTRNQIDVSNNVYIRSKAQQFFGESFDFVKEITEVDGTIIYMYGYGDKALKINRNGTLEYIEKTNKENSQAKLDFLDSLKYASKFVTDKGDWPVNKENAYLYDYEVTEENNEKSYVFYFAYRLHGLPVHIPDEDKNRGIEVKVTGEQVTYYQRIVRVAGQQLDNKETIIPSINTVWEKNSTSIKSNYLRENQLEGDKIEDFKISEKIRNIQLCYFLYQDKLIPVWEITIDNIVYYFDLYNGENYTSYPKD